MIKTVAVIPTYNEEKTIAEIVTMAKKHCARVIVVDNMSTDKTCEEAGKAMPCHNIYRSYVRGAGAATALGLAHSLNLLKPYCCKAIVTLDGDGQHNPGEILLLLEPIRRGEADIVIGSRFIYPSNGNMPKYRAFGIKTVNWFVNVFSPVKFTDTLCCFRAFTREAVKALPIEDDGFGFGTEMLIKARKKGLRVKEVPVTSIYHEDFWQNHTMWPLWHGLSLVWATIKWRIKCAS